MSAIKEYYHNDIETGMRFPREKERPIIFSTPMVKAILESVKIQTRRIIKPQPIKKDVFWELYGAAWSEDHGYIPCMPGHSLSTRNPYGQNEDLLWVRETFMYSHFYPDNGQVVIKYKAGGQRLIENYPYWILNKNLNKWKPSIHMPKAAARIWLKISEIGIERLQDITEEQAIAEGVGSGCHVNAVWPDYINMKTGLCSTARKSFASLWKSINGPESWDNNPWVWVIHFRIINELNNKII